jgi:hypothetical protein
MGAKAEVEVRSWNATEDEASMDASDTGGEASMEPGHNGVEGSTTSSTNVGEAAKEVLKKYWFTCFITIPGIGSSTGSGLNLTALSSSDAFSSFILNNFLCPKLPTVVIIFYELVFTVLSPCYISILLIKSFFFSHAFGTLILEIFFVACESRPNGFLEKRQIEDYRKSP